jgi:hypothetical protein
MNFELNFPELDQSSGLNLGSELNSGSTTFDEEWRVRELDVTHVWHCIFVSKDGRQQCG